MAIGLVSVYWSEVENTIARIIWELAKLRSHRGPAVTAHLNERTRADMCKALAHDIFGWSPLAADLDKHLTYITDKLYPRRNAVVHATWGFTPERWKSSTLPVKARGGKVKFGPR